MTTSHTPGPWNFNPPRDGYSGALVCRGDAIVAEAWAVDEGGTQAANARLIAAAPDLLAALREIASCPLNVEGYNSLSSLRLRYVTLQTIARAAIAKVQV